MQKCIGIPYQNQMKNLYDTCINALKCIVHSDKKSVKIQLITQDEISKSILTL